MVDALLKMDGEILLFIQDHIRQEWMDWFWKAVTHLGDGLRVGLHRHHPFHG